jgi:hypothetical protein
MLPDLLKIKHFTSNGTVKKEMSPRDLHFLCGYKPNILLGCYTAVKKFGKYMEESGGAAFTLSVSANNVYRFCFWAGRDKGKTSKQEITAKTIEKYLHGVKAWHLPRREVPRISGTHCEGSTPLICQS